MHLITVPLSGIANAIELARHAHGGLSCEQWCISDKVEGHEPLNPPASFAFRIAVQTETGVAGIVMWRIWNSLSALTIALITAAGAGVVPPSPPAFMPSGFVGDRTSTISVVNDGKVSERGMP